MGRAMTLDEIVDKLVHASRCIERYEADAAFGGAYSKNNEIEYNNNLSEIIRMRETLRSMLTDAGTHRN
jgi:hypothetical protein